MTNEIDKNVIEQVRALYHADEAARVFLDHCAERERDASATSVDRIAYRLDVSRETAVGVAQALEEAGCGTFVLGRRGHKSRFVWDYSCISVGQAAAGEVASLEEPDDAIEDVNSLDALGNSSENVPFSIGEAKKRLAKALDVPIDTIKISIEA